MATLKSLDYLLEASSRIFDLATSEIRDIPLEPKKEYIRKIGHALTLIFELQFEIHKVDPSLEPDPDYLKQPALYPGEGGSSRRLWNYAILMMQNSEALNVPRRVLQLAFKLSPAAPNYHLEKQQDV